MIENDIRYRSETCKLYQDGDCYYYEDDIIGFQGFQRWIRSYGTSIVVLEPESLKNEVVQQAHEVLKKYEQAKSWDI